MGPEKVQRDKRPEQSPVCEAVGAWVSSLGLLKVSPQSETQGYFTHINYRWWYVGCLRYYCSSTHNIIVSLAIEAQLSDQSHFTAWLHPESQLCDLEWFVQISLDAVFFLPVTRECWCLSWGVALRMIDIVGKAYVTNGSHTRVSCPVVACFTCL